MKKSTILIVSALVFFLGSLTAFNFAMKAEYETGHYKDPFFRFVPQDFTGFNTVEVNGASKITVKIVQGPFKVLLQNRVQNFVQVKQDGSKLVVDVNLTDENSWSNGQHVVYVSCPDLTSLTTTARYTLAGKSQHDLYSDNSYYSKIVSVIGFKQDQLSITQDHATAVELVGNQLGNFKAVAGITPGSSSRLIIKKGNQINSAALDMRNKSSLYLSDVVIPSVSYQFSDSARANFAGKALQVLSKR